MERYRSTVQDGQQNYNQMLFEDDKFTNVPKWLLKDEGKLGHTSLEPLSCSCSDNSGVFFCLFASAIPTAKILSKFDKIFDCINCCTFNTADELNKPMTVSSKHVQIMQKILQDVRKIKLVNPANNKDVTTNLKCLNTLQKTLKPTSEVWKAIL